MMLQVNSINCDTSWKISLFMDYRDNKECVLKGVTTYHYHDWCTCSCFTLISYIIRGTEVTEYQSV